MSAKRKRKRRQLSRSNKPQSTEPYGPGGKFVSAGWAVVLVLMVATYFGYQAQMMRQGYAHMPVLWLVILVILVLMAIGMTMQWYGSKSDRTERSKRP